MRDRSRQEMPALLSGIVLFAAGLSGVVAVGADAEFAASPRVTRLVSPHGRSLAFAVDTVDSWGDRTTKLIASDLDGSNRREVKSLEGRVADVFWWGNDRLLWAEDSHTYRLVSLKGEELPKIKLPERCDISYSRLSPDGQRLAYIGSYEPAGGESQHGLFVVELKTGEVRRLIDKALKTAPAWSSDSRKLAIGNSPGYGNWHPLVIVDVPSGEITETGVRGVGAAWSHDGRFLAFSTEILRGGSWSSGIPVDGRIGVLQIQSNRLTRVTPPAYNISDRENDRRDLGGSLRPVWSPDGRWIAYHRWVSSRRGDEEKEAKETWVVNREGTEFRKALDRFEPFAWTRDSKALIFVTGGQIRQIDLDELEGLSLKTMLAKYPPPPEPLAKTTPEAVQYDPAPIFARNRPWLNPRLDHLESVQFTHCMEPIRLNERFLWRRDGTSLLEVVYREDESAAKEIGRRWLTTPEPAQYYFSPGVRLAKRETRQDDFFTGYFRSHLMGTSANFVALDWGRDPQAFTIRNVQQNPDEGTTTIHLAPRLTRQRRRYYLNAGAMFQTTSWAYVHHLEIVKGEITIDSENRRILREIDYSKDGEKKCQIDFADWQDVGDGQSVPRSIHLRFPANNNFDVTYRFQWRPEGLWILESSQSSFNNEDPQREEIRNLKINEPVPELDEMLAAVENSSRELEGGDATPGEPRVLTAHPFHLGKTVRLAEETQKGSEPRVRSILFTLHASHSPAYPNLVAEIGVTDDREKPGPNDSLVLVLLDGSGRPVSSHRAPLAATPDEDRPAPEAPLDAGTSTVVYDQNTKTRRITMNFGRLKILNTAEYWTLALLTPGATPSDDDVRKIESPHYLAGKSRLDVLTYPFTLDSPLLVGMFDETKKKTQIRRVRLERNPHDELLAKLEIVSADHWTSFIAVTSAVLLDRDNSLIAAACDSLSMRVERDIVATDEIVLNLGKTIGPANPARLVLGLKTVHTGGFGPSTWHSIIDDSPLFPIEQMLAAEDPAAWRAGLWKLDDQFRRELLWREEENRFRQRSHRRTPTRQKVLGPHLDRLAVLLKEGHDPQGLAILCRLLGHSGEKRFIDDMLGLLKDSRPTVQDGAAIGLGLLGDASSFERLVAILERDLPENDAQHRAFQEYQTDAARALRAIDKDEAVGALGEALLRTLDRITVTPNPDPPSWSGASRKKFGGPTSLAHNLAQILGGTDNPAALDYFSRALQHGEPAELIEQTVVRILPRFKKQAKTLQIFIEGIRRGRSCFVSYAPTEPTLVPEVAAMILREDLDDRGFNVGLQFLTRAGDPQALESLREAHERKLHPDYEDGRIWLAKALATYDDYRGFEEMFDLLLRLEDSSTLPDDAREKRREEKRRKKLTDKITPIFALKSVSATKYAPPPELAEFLARRLESTDLRAFLAALKIVESLPEIPEGLKPALENLASHPDEEVAKRASRLAETWK